eukprot:TRINITY_DN28248_c0_g1_i1.p1 TRINITY_DN28248_c0_g1~~TRINITY_DN28248_c0_g1_i1.p1  ORF type:complete len:423 (+),score=63.97 TRINITY_DN28248_c0_g1_i1:166-1269(+)
MAGNVPRASAASLRSPGSSTARAGAGAGAGDAPPRPGAGVGSAAGASRGSIGGCLREALAVWCAGVRDALAVHRCLFFVARSEVIRFRTVQCFMLNGVIFMGSIALFEWAVVPLLAALRHVVGEEEAWAADFVGASFGVLYKVLWIYPIYCISFVLNTVMYQDLADGALALSKRKLVPQATSPLVRLINEAYRVLLNLIYIVEMNLLYYVPLVGPVLYFVHSCWLASIYCFEYRWVHLQWTSNQRLAYFEAHWLYFVGFGFPASFISFMCPRFVDAGVFALLFPLCILEAVSAEPRALKRVPSFVRSLPVFFIVQGVSCMALRIFEGRLAASPRAGASASSAAKPGQHAPSAKDSPATSHGSGKRES